MSVAMGSRYLSIEDKIALVPVAGVHATRSSLSGDVHPRSVGVKLAKITDTPAVPPQPSS